MARADLWMPIRAIPALDWILLTKGPQNIVGMLPVDWGEGWPNVWLGTTTENQIEAARRIPHLVAIPAAVRFLSVEPMLKAIDLSPWLGELSCAIVGGESGIGKRARAMHPDWLRALRDQLQAAGVAMFVKRVGSNRAAWPGIRLSGRPICAFRIYRGKLPARHEAAMPHNTSYRAPRRPLDAGRSAVPSTPAGSPPGFRASKQVQRGMDDYSLVLNGATNHKSFGWRTFRPFTPAEVEEVLYNPPPRIAKNGSDIRKLQTCMENVVPHLRILPR